MGYRSDVSLTIEKPDFDKLLEEINSSDHYVKQMFNSAKKLVCGSFVTLY